METYTKPQFSRWFPAHAGLSILLCSLLSGAVGVGATFLGVTVFREYGWALFLGVPLVMGILVPLLHGIGAPRSLMNMFLANVATQWILFISLVLLGIEGLGCLVMAAPLWFILCLFGTSIAYTIHLAMWRGYINPRGFPVIGLLLVVSLPLWMGAEYVAPPQPELIAAQTVVEIDAPPEVVWRNLLAFPELAPPTEWIFKLGVAYPIHAVIAGHGPGAVRRCEFSTGAFIEPITIWEENHRLAFDVVASPPSMKEMNPFWDIHPAHLEGYLISRHGQFLLTDLGHNRTRLEGTTWYENKMYPAAYWQLWSDAIIHRIHLRVLNHVKALSETEAAMDAPKKPNAAALALLTGEPEQ